LPIVPALAFAASAVAPVAARAQPHAATSRASSCTSYSLVDVCGAYRAAYRTIGGTRSDLGPPRSGELKSVGPFARFGDRKVNFAYGAIYRNSATGRTTVATWRPLKPGAPLATRIRARRAAQEQARAADLPPGGCPDGTTDYKGTAHVYSCRNVFDDNVGYPEGLRNGFESVGDDGADDSGEDIAKGFGLVHAQEDHNIGPHSIALIVADTPPEENGKHPARWNYPMALLFNGNIEEVLTVVVQKAPDEMKRTPDAYDFGVVTAFCRVGTIKPGYSGYCSSDLPPPFNGGALN
jgi:hypothetical protein